ncbi:MAG: hypothetical protein IJW37_01980 [Lachnospiraceae bacterium]|nr:hypothetical protein [Lachnospiraceae bacterium]
MAQNNEKQLTNYDRKRLAKEEAAKREKKKQIITVAVAIAIVVAIVALIVLVPLAKKRKALGEYIRVNDVSISQLEFTYYKTSVINNYSSFLPYLGLDTSVSLDQQIYDEETGMTWNDFFDQQAVISIRENKAMVADAAAKGLTFDITEDYNAYLESMKTAAETAGMKLDNYLVSLFGNSASEKNLKPIVEDDLTSLAYYNHLVAESAPTDEEAQAKYDEDPSQYDSVDYRMLDFAADVTEESTEEEISAAMEAVTAKAQEMLDKLNAGEDFETLCAEYAPEDERADYEDTETDHSLRTNLTKSTSYLSYTDWLFEDQEEGATTLYTDEENNTVYVLKFEKRYMGDTVLDDIKQTLTYDAVTEYINTISEDYTVTDPKGNLTFPLDTL